ncbi:hypothetical protein F4W66_25510 (plasmid) [Escherichia coli]|nr:hypothetical protein F4W66_25510 [Escherichia coli]BEC77630.1 hypothetical protein VEE58_48040 [Escherichia coli]
MTKHDFVSFVSGELRQGAVRFSLAFNSKGEIVLHWTNKAGIRVWRIGNDSNLLIVFYVQIMPDDFVMQLHRF